MSPDRDGKTLRVTVPETAVRGPMTAAVRASRYRARKRGDPVEERRPGPKKYPAAVPDWLPGGKLAAPAYVPAPEVPATRAARRGVAERALRDALAAVGRLRGGDLGPELADLLGDVIAAAEDLLSRHER